MVQALAGTAQWVEVFLIFTVPAFRWASSPKEIALLAACLGAPSLVLGPFVGAFLDRADPRKLVTLGVYSRLISSVLIAFVPAYWAFALLVFLKGIANVLYWPASFILTNQIIGEGERTRYFSSLSLCEQLSKVLTPLVVGTVALVVGSQESFLLVAGLAIISAALLPGLLSNIALTRCSMQRSSIGEPVNSSAFAMLKTLSSSLKIAIGLGVGMSLTLALYDSHLPSFLSYSGFDAQAFSLIVAGTAVGAALGALSVRLFFIDTPPAQLMRDGIFGFTLALIGAALLAVHRSNSSVCAYVLLWVLNGFSHELFVIGLGVHLQSRCPRELLGRVSSSMRSLQMLAVVTGPGIGAWLIAQKTRAYPFIAAATIAMGLLLVALVALNSKAKNSAQRR